MDIEEGREGGRDMDIEEGREGERRREEGRKGGVYLHTSWPSIAS